MMTVGPWRPIHLDTYTYRFEDVRIDTDLLGPEYKSGTLKADIQLNTTKLPGGASIKAVLFGLDGAIIKEEALMSGDKLNWTFDKGEIDGWYPINYGSQPLYNFHLTLIDDVSSCHRSTRGFSVDFFFQKGLELVTSSSRIAFRHARVVQEPLDDQEGTTFLFEVNGIRIFCGGSNWIPGDSFLTEMDGDRYKRWIDLMVSLANGTHVKVPVLTYQAEGNQNMLRIWAGGIYEDEALYK